MRELAIVVLVLALLTGYGPGRPREATPAEPPATPSVTKPTTPNERVVGNWSMVHRVDPPAGWTVIDRTLYGFAEMTSLSRSDDDEQTCVTEVWGVGKVDLDPAERDEDVTIDGRPGYTSTGSSSGVKALYWEYRTDAWARVVCMFEDDFRTARMMAERTVFEPSSLRVAVRLGWVPDDYQVSTVSESGYRGRIGSIWRLSPRSGGGKTPDITVTAGEGESNLTRVTEGIERDTVAGYPALLQPGSGTIDLDAGRYLIGLQSVGDAPPDRWAPGRRELLVRLAENLEVAEDIGDRDTWFDAETALPS